jgi:hypothetical protein
MPSFGGRTNLHVSRTAPAMAPLTALSLGRPPQPLSAPVLVPSAEADHHNPPLSAGCQMRGRPRSTKV